MANELQALVERYIMLRDKKAEIVNAAKEKAAKLDDLIKKLEGALLLTFQQTGAESVRTAAGTAYKTTKASATVADWDAVLGFIKDNEMWNMLERRVSKEAVVQFREANNDLPPGVNWREEVTINVRRS